MEFYILSYLSAVFTFITLVLFLIFYIFMDSAKENKGALLKSFYYYLVSFVALMMMVVASISIITSVLKMTVFPKASNYYMSFVGSMPGCDASTSYPGAPVMSAEECAQQKEMREKEMAEGRMRDLQQSLVWSVSVLIVAAPLFIAHWQIARKKA